MSKTDKLLFGKWERIKFTLVDGRELLFDYRTHVIHSGLGGYRFVRKEDEVEIFIPDTAITSIYYYKPTQGDEEGMPASVIE